MKDTRAVKIDEKRLFAKLTHNEVVLTSIQVHFGWKGLMRGEALVCYGCLKNILKPLEHSYKFVKPPYNDQFCLITFNNYCDV